MKYMNAGKDLGCWGIYKKIYLRGYEDINVSGLGTKTLYYAVRFRQVRSMEKKSLRSGKVRASPALKKWGGIKKELCPEGYTQPFLHRVCL